MESGLVGCVGVHQYKTKEDGRLREQPWTFTVPSSNSEVLGSWSEETRGGQEGRGGGGWGGAGGLGPSSELQRTVRPTFPGPQEPWPSPLFLSRSSAVLSVVVTPVWQPPLQAQALG